MAAGVTFGVLGPVEAWADGHRLPLGTPQQRTILAVILLNEGSVTSTGELAAALWAEDPPAGAVKTIRTYVSRLRAVLEPGGETIESVARGYLLRPGADRFDLARLRSLTAGLDSRVPAPDRADRAREALAIFRGEPLAGLNGSWADIHRARLSDLRAATYETLFAAELEIGLHAGVIAEIPAVISQFPFREKLRELQILALHRAGLRAAALSAYREVHQLLDQELGVEPMAALQDLHQRILRNDPELLPQPETAPEPVQPDVPESSRPATPAPRERTAPRSRPAQLPAAPTLFTGRDDELRRADQVLEAAGQRLAVVVFTGMGGVGKTSTALYWAHRLADRYGDGQLYTDLRGYGPGGDPLSPDAVLGSFLQSLGVPPADVPEGVEARAATFRSLVADRSMLLLLDNAATADQVLDLLPGSGRSLVIVTSRGTLPALVVRTAAPLIPLQPPDQDEALALFAARVGADRVRAEPTAAHDIVELCGRLPLALAVVAARAAAAAHLPLAAVADELRSTHGTLSAFHLPDEVFDPRAVFSWSYQAIGEEPAEAFRRLCLHPGPDLNVEVAASMLARPPAETRRLLADLVTAALVTEHVPGRWKIHDLLRAYGDELARDLDHPQQRRATLQRLLDYYLHAGRISDSRLFKRQESDGGEEPLPGVVLTDAEPTAWFADEHLALLSALDLAAREGFDRQAWQLSWVVRDYLNRQGLWHHVQMSQSAGLAAAIRGGQPAAEARARWGVAFAASNMGSYEEAHVQLRHALALYEQLGDRDGVERTRLFTAGVLDLQGRWQEALEQFRALLALHPPGSDPTARARILIGVSWSNTELGRFAEAITDAREVIGMGAELHPFRVADTWDTIGRAQAGLGDLDEATDSYRRAVDLYLEHKAPVWAAQSLRHLGDALGAADRVPEAEKAYREALTLVDNTAGPQAAQLGAELELLLSGLTGRG
ncbi:AfsR/SARP family transcriptional regulator [Actinoplanes cyaneus]|uniref:AfsR/SARP family transcriptional regulator n=1 Tax=Actinoplanes cyaneus TaxID=52696 RepID=UPI001941F89E|nr:BTAD domain-containing putative transcriptional regulator [Actinoplanes cyaneus]MCW2142242.1 DNA-binding transcriptional activator of the SARP family [Actinoplanes cyaneus]